MTIKTKEEIEKLRYSANAAVKTVQAISSVSAVTDNSDVIVDADSTEEFWEEEASLAIENTEEANEDSESESIERAFDEANHNTMILQKFSEGYTPVEIARKLGIGLGEVKLVIDLFEEDKTSEV